MVLSDVLWCALYNIVCPCWFWPWYCLTFFDVFCITWIVLVGFRHGIVWRYVRQYQCQNQQGQTMLCKTHRRTSDNTIAKTNKNKQCYKKHIEERQTLPWFCITLFALVGFGHGIVWRSSMCFVLHCLSLLGLAMVKTNKNKQCHTKHIEERQTIPCPKPTRTSNVIQNTSKNVRQYLYNIVSPFWFWPWYCLTFFDVLCITLFVLVGFGHGIVWRSSMCFV
jgi:hypothetical protein